MPKRRVPESDKTCLTEDDLIRHLNGQISKLEQIRVTLHLTRCRICRATIRALRKRTLH